MDKIEWVNKLRRSELDLVIPFLIKRAKILEIGAGTGYQANILRELGYNVVPIDLQISKRIEPHSRLHAEYRKLKYDKVNNKTIKTINAAGYPIILDALSNMGFSSLLFSTIVPLTAVGGLMIFAMFACSIGTLTILASSIEIFKHRIY